jgi:hypothetical protein
MEIINAMKKKITLCMALILLGLMTSVALAQVTDCGPGTTGSVVGDYSLSFIRGVVFTCNGGFLDSMSVNLHNNQSANTQLDVAVYRMSDSTKVDSTGIFSVTFQNTTAWISHAFTVKPNLPSGTYQLLFRSTTADPNLNLQTRSGATGFKIKRYDFGDYWPTKLGAEGSNYDDYSFESHVYLHTGGCSNPTNALTFTDSTLTTVKIQNVISGGNTTKDSTQYFNNGVYVMHLHKADSTTQRIIFSGLSLGSTHYIKAISWDSTCSKTDSILTKTLAAPSPLVSCQIDSIAGHADSAWFVFVTPNQAADDTVYIRVSTSACGDSSTVTLRKVFANNTTDSIKFATTGTTPFTSYVSGWVKEVTHGVSARVCANKAFGMGIPSPTALVSCAIDSIAGRSDSAWFVYTTPSEAGNDYVRAWVDTVYHDSTTTQTVQKAYVANKTDSIKIGLPYVVTFSARVSGYVYDAVAGYSSRSQANRTFHAAGSGSTGNCDTGTLESEINSLSAAVGTMYTLVQNQSLAFIKAQDSLNAISAEIAYLRTHSSGLDSTGAANAAKGALASTPVKIPVININGDTLPTLANIFDPNVDTLKHVAKVDTVKLVLVLSSPQNLNITGNINGNLSGSAGSVTGNVGGSVNSVTLPVTVTSNADIIAMKAKTDLFTFSGNYVRSDQRQINGTNAQDSSGYPKVASVRGGIGGNIVGSVASVTGPVGSINGITFPLNFGSFKISLGGYASPNFTDINGTLASTHFDNTYWHKQALASDSGAAGGVGGGTDWNNNEKDQIRQALGIDGDKLPTSDGDLLDIKDQTDQFSFDPSGRVYSHGGATDTIARVSGNVGGNVSGNVSGSVNSVTTPVTITSNSDMTGIKGKTDLIPSGGFPTNFSNMQITAGGYISPNFNIYLGQLGSSAYDNTYWHKSAQAADSGGGSSLGTLGPEVTAIKNKTDHLQFSSAGDSIIAKGLSASSGGGTAIIPDSLLRAVTDIKSIKANTDAWANLQFDTLTNRTVIIAALIDAQGDSVFPSYLTFRPLKADSTYFRTADNLRYGSGANARAMVITERTIKGDASGSFEFPIIPGALTNFPTMLYEFKGYFNLNGHSYDQVRVVIAVPEQTENFNPFGE